MVLGKLLVRNINGTQFCGNGRFQCEKSGICLPQNYKCDGEIDCPFWDDSDEQNCEKIKCNERKFPCKDGKRCLPQNFVCDGEKDCEDNSDEQECPSE